MDQSSPNFGFAGQSNNADSSQFAARFAQMLRDYPDALADRKRFIGLLKDLFPQQKKEVNLLSLLYDFGITAEIESTGGIDNVFTHRFKKRLQDEYGVTEDDAKWAVAAWCGCYGGNILGNPCGIADASPIREKSAAALSQRSPAKVEGTKKAPPHVPKPKEAYSDEATKKLLFVVKNASMEEVTRLIQEGADVNAVVGSLGKTPLMIAARFNENPDVLRVLIDNRADVNAVDDDGKTPLMLAAKENSNPDALQILIDNGADVNAVVEEGLSEGMTPLMYAARFNENPDVLRVLIDSGANVNAVDGDGMTPLMFATWFNENPDVLRLLMDKGANVAIKDKEGKNALDYAYEYKDLKGTDAYNFLREKTLSRN